MHFIDWFIVVVTLALVGGIAIYTQRYVKGIADFLAAGRVAGRYVVAVATGEAGMGLISVVAIWEMYYNSGVAIHFWSAIVMPVGLIMTLTGFCIYRFRESRALTMGQMLEERYSRSLRIFASCISALSGIVNYGIFPAVGARFLIYFCNLPVQLHILGMQVPTFAVLMALFLFIGASLAILGGQLTVMTTDCVMGILSYPIYLVVVVALLYQFSWFRDIVPALSNQPAGQSMINPFDVSALRDFNPFYVFVGIFAMIYTGGGITWLGTQGYNAAAINAHEQKMARILSSWRAGFSSLMIVLTAIVVLSFMNSPRFAERAAETRHALQVKAIQDIAPEYSPAVNNGIVSKEMIKQSLTKLKANNPGKYQTYDTIRKQMRVPLALSNILPIGVLGAFCALMIFLLISTDSTYLHSWGSILIQDIYLPFSKKKLTPKKQLLFLRMAIALVALYAFCFSFFFGQATFILMFFAITGAIWAGAGAVIILGLYWRRGTTSGAFAALISGATIAIGGFLLTKFWAGSIYPWLAEYPALLEGLSNVVSSISAPFGSYIKWKVSPDKFYMNGQELNFMAMITAVIAYIVISLLTCREKFNMERMLHRGKYAHKDEKLQTNTWAEVRKKGLGATLRFFAGIDENFSLGDKLLSYSVLIWSIGITTVTFIIPLIWNAISPWSKEWWGMYYFIFIICEGCFIGLISTVWFSIGCTKDLIKMFARLKVHQSNVNDDGRVIGHLSAEDVLPVMEDAEDEV